MSGLNVEMESFIKTCKLFCVDKYINGFHKSKHRTSSNCLTPYSVINTGKMVHQNLLMKILKQSRKLRMSMIHGSKIGMQEEKR